MKEQRRGRKIAMTQEEVDAFLEEQRTCHVGTSGGDGAPHVSPLWFVWDGAALWLNSVVKSQRWTNLMRDPRISGGELGLPQDEERLRWPGRRPGRGAARRWLRRRRLFE